MQALGLLPLPNLNLLCNNGLYLGVELGALVVPICDGHYQRVWLLIQHVRMIPLTVLPDHHHEPFFIGIAPPERPAR